MASKLVREIEILEQIAKTAERIDAAIGGRGHGYKHEHINPDEIIALLGDQRLNLKRLKLLKGD